MENLWDDNAAQRFSDSDLDMRVYTSRLLGTDADLVLHGGGNTSVKVTEMDLFGEPEEILYVKGSGWDLKTIEPAGFAPTRLTYLQRLGTLDAISDTRMAKELKASQIDPSAPAPSVEAILHANIPLKFVDHTHADAVVAVSNTPNGAATLKTIFTDRVLILPYVMPGFMLSKQVFDATQDSDWSALDGIFLMHHGLFTFADDAKASYDNMITLVSLVEDYLAEMATDEQFATAHYAPTTDDLITLAQLRKTVSGLAEQPMLAHWKLDDKSVGFSTLANAAAIAGRGPLTPDHTLHTKRTAAALTVDPVADVHTFSEDYIDYFRRHTDGTLTCLDPAPRFAIWQNKGCLAFGMNHKRLGVVSDITDHTLKAIQWAESLGGWKALPQEAIFDIEYWELEQAKLKKIADKPAYEGKIVLVTGGAAGIGRACVDAFLSQGACVVAVDINPAITDCRSGDNYLGMTCDLTHADAVIDALRTTVTTFGGLDVIVSNAGTFPPSARIESLSDATFQQSMAINVTSHLTLLREAIPFLKAGIDPAVILVASKNVPAPGPGACAYSAAKAALTQLGRVAALELGEYGIRVNMLHPNAVFDTSLWTDEVLAQRADHYGMSVDEYKRNNLLKTEITSADVAALAVTMAGAAFANTTGAQLPIDGGNERVI